MTREIWRADAVAAVCKQIRTDSKFFRLMKKTLDILGNMLHIICNVLPIF